MLDNVCPTAWMNTKGAFKILKYTISSQVRDYQNGLKSSLKICFNGKITTDLIEDNKS